MSEKLIGGRYRLRDLVGKGGFGAVYVADQVGLDRPVALKLLHQQRMNAASRARFEREARLAQRLEHPNTVRLLDFGCDGGDAPYIAFELLRGTSLAAILKAQGALPARRVARIASQALKSLMEAHALGIVHRDIKPANLFISEHSGESDFCKVLDFGIAKTLESQSKVLTNAGEVVGTPAYMAPEIIAGRPLTPASDLYSLGIVMAEMLSGARLLTGSAVAIMEQHLSAQPLVLPDVITRGPLADVVRRATAKDPAARYSDAAAMLRDIDALGPALERPSPPPLAATTPLGPNQSGLEPSLAPIPPVATAATLSATAPELPPARADGINPAHLIVAAVAAFGFAAIVAIGLVAFFLLRAEEPSPPLPRAKIETPERKVLPPPASIPAPPTRTPLTTAAPARPKQLPSGKPSTSDKPCYREVIRDGLKRLEVVPCGDNFGY